MSLIDDVTLMAFADGELDEARAGEVREALKHDAGLRARLERLGEVDQLLRASFAADLDTPDRFAVLLADGQAPEGAGAGGLAAAGGATIISMHGAGPRHGASQRFRRWIPAATGIAAALLIVFTGGIMPGPQLSWLEQVDDGLALTGPMQEAMLVTPSGSTLRRDGFSITPVVSFQSGDGRLCREVQVHQSELSARILACRDRDENEWCIEALARMPAARDTGAYYTAGLPKDPVIEAAYARLKATTTLSAAAERDAIARKWVR